MDFGDYNEQVTSYGARSSEPTILSTCLNALCIDDVAYFTMTTIKIKSVDDILVELNPFGRLQVWFMVCSAYIQFFMPMNSQSINFIGAKPDFHCSAREGYLLNESVPLVEDDDGELVFSQCKEYIDPWNSNATQDCQNGWTYSPEFYGETIITEWNLVCDQNPAAAEAAQSILQIGGMFGGLIIGTIADRYGRRPSVLGGVILYCISGLGICFSPNYATFMVLRFISGVSEMSVWIAFCSYSSEYMIPKYRSRAMTIPAIGFSFGLMLLSLLAFLIHDWRYLQLAIISPLVVGFFGFWFLPESLRWLLSKNKVKEVERLIQKLAKINGIELPRDEESNKNAKTTKPEVSAISGNTVISSPPEDQTQSSKISDTIENNREDGLDKKYLEDTTENEKENDEKFNSQESADLKCSHHKNYFDLLKPPVLHVTIVIAVLRFVYQMVYFGFALSTGRLAGNPYLNFFLSALVEIPARLLSPLLYRKFRRTYLVCFCLVSCGAGLTVIIFIPEVTKGGTNLNTLITVLSLVGKFFVTLSRAGILLLIMELFPTILRNSGNGLSLALGKIGAIIAPFILYLDNLVPNLSIILMAVMSFLGAGCVLTLPDTRRTVQPQNAADLKEIMSTRRKESKLGLTNNAFEADTGTHL